MGSDIIEQIKQVKDFLEAAEYIKDRLYFVTLKNRHNLRSTPTIHYFNTDDVFVYHNYYDDFGPVSLGCFYRFSRLLSSKLTSKALRHSAIVYWTVLDNSKRANAAFLISAFAIASLNFSPREAISPWARSKYQIMPFVDANLYGANNIYTIRIIDCLNGLNRAFYFGLVNFSDFDIDEYELFEGSNLSNPGDLNWIVPRKLIAFAGPCGEGNGNCPVSFYINYFKRENVQCIIRLNKSVYDANSFTEHGITHQDLFFPDGTTPSKEILNAFLEITERSTGAVAVHCKAGLGRTGCLIGCYLMKHYRMGASEAIAWMRICRPGCVIGSQQTWLESMQPMMWRLGEEYRILHHGGPDKMRQHKYGIYSLKAKRDRPSQADPKSHFSIKEKVKNRRATKSELEMAPSSTQGDMLMSARRANLNKNKRMSTR